MAGTVVYLRGPGTVVRCRTCSAILMVISRIRGMNCVDLTGLAALAGPDTTGYHLKHPTERNTGHEHELARGIHPQMNGLDPTMAAPVFTGRAR